MRLALGAAGGLAGTVILDGIRRANQKWIPEGSPPMKEDPAKFMTRKLEAALPEPARRRVLPQAKTVLEKLLPLGYGMTFGVLYATVRPEAKPTLADGLVLGLLSWAIGWLGWLPRLGLMPPISEHAPKQIIRPVAEHALFGVATVAGYRYLAQRARQA